MLIFIGMNYADIFISLMLFMVVRLSYKNASPLYFIGLISCFKLLWIFFLPFFILLDYYNSYSYKKVLLKTLVSLIPISVLLSYNFFVVSNGSLGTNFNKELFLLSQTALQVKTNHFFTINSLILCLPLIFLFFIYLLRLRSYTVFYLLLSLFFIVFFPFFKFDIGFILWYMAIFFALLLDARYIFNDLNIIFTTASLVVICISFFTGQIFIGLLNILSYYVFLGGLLFLITIHTILLREFLKKKLAIFPLTLSFTGDSGSGKTTYSSFFTKALSSKNVNVIEGDGFHRWERNAPEWEKNTHLHPFANQLYQLFLTVKKLKRNYPVKHSIYDHHSGTFKVKKQRPKNFILIEGLHSLILSRMRNVLDVSVFFDTEESLLRTRKINRDLSERNKSQEDIENQIERRKEDRLKYILPQREFADILVFEDDKNLRLKIKNSYDYFILEKYTQGIPSIFIDIDENFYTLGFVKEDLKKEHLTLFQEFIISSFKSINISVDNIKLEKDPKKIFIGCFILYYIFDKIVNE